ncbi:mitochondrial carrier domain-containing protein [Limtongia smithiae]|uniref:mitochondrial carrier domain-containing protein n=1 Tax=Limtongia smithiae TaxID=1125753 RepID=UPI0034CE6082
MQQLEPEDGVEIEQLPASGTAVTAPLQDAHGRDQVKVEKFTRRESIICGALAGVTSRFFVAPLDVIKIRQQLQSEPRRLRPFTTGVPPPTYRGILHSIYRIYTTEGLTALWRGNLPAELLYLLYGAVQFATLHQTNAVLATYAPSVSPNVHHFVSGALAGALATTATYPLDLLRTRFAAQGSGPGDKAYGSMMASIPQIYKTEGMRGFFRGLRPAISQVVPYMGIFFAAYTPAKSAVSYASMELGIRTFGFDDALAGMFAGVVSKTGVFPLDVIRKRLQVQGPTRHMYVLKHIPAYPDSIIGCAVKIVTAEGVLGLYRGLFVSLVKSAPASAITMWVYEHSVVALRCYDTFKA